VLHTDIGIYRAEFINTSAKLNSYLLTYNFIYYIYFLVIGPSLDLADFYFHQLVSPLQGDQNLIPLNFKGTSNTTT